MKPPPRKCSWPGGCSVRVYGRRTSRCEAHGGTTDRPNPRERGYDSRWETEIRPAVLFERPWCECPPDCGCGPRAKVTSPTGSYDSCVRRSTVVDHRSPRRAELKAGRDPERRENLQALSATCHARKTNRHDGGFGNPIRPLPIEVNP